MIRGGDFYAIWIEEQGLWSTDENDALQLIDKELDEYVEKNKKNLTSIQYKCIFCYSFIISRHNL